MDTTFLYFGLLCGIVFVAIMACVAMSRINGDDDDEQMEYLAKWSEMKRLKKMGKRK